MPKGYARIVYLIGRTVDERRKAIASEPLPQRLAELLCRLSESDKAEQTLTAKRAAMVKADG